MDYQASDFLFPNQWEADTQPCGHAGYARQPDTIIIQHFLMNVKSFLFSNPRTVTPRKLKHGDLTGEC